MIKFIKNDGGRAAAGYRGRARDCVARAIAILTGNEYEVVYGIVALINRENGGKRSARNAVSKTVTRQSLMEFDLIKVPLGAGVKPTFTEAYEQYGNCIVTTNRHVCAIVDGALQDTQDIRTYLMDGSERVRKARSVWIKDPEIYGD